MTVGEARRPDHRSRARRMWSVFEVVHVPVYFAPEPVQAYLAVGLHGYWRGYYAGRVSPLGAVGPDHVIPIFYGFAPRHVARALPDIWDRTTPADALAARRSGVSVVLEREWRDLGGLVSRTAAALREAVDAADLEGCPLGSANRDLGLPDDPVATVWQACTVLREARGDGHVRALRAQGVGPCESLVVKVGLGAPRAALQPHRGWTDEEWDAAADSLRGRGWLDPDGVITPKGREVDAAVEAMTDDAADSPWRALGDDRAAALYDGLAILAEPLRPLIPDPNPMVLPAP